MNEDELKDQEAVTPEAAQESAEVAQGEEVSANEVAKEETPSKRDVIIARLKSAYPEDDSDFSDDETLYGKLDEYAIGRDNDLNSYEERDAKLKDLAERDPKGAELIGELIDGSDVLDSLIGVYGEDLRNALDDPEYKQKMEDKKAQTKAIQEQQDKNIAEYGENLTQFMEGKEMDDEQQKSFTDFMANIADNVLLFKFDNDTLETLYKGFTHDADVEDAMSEGETKGRNAKIELEKRSFDTDGVPSSSKSNAPSGRNSAGRDIWELGKYNI